MPLKETERDVYNFFSQARKVPKPRRGCSGSFSKDDFMGLYEKAAIRAHAGAHLAILAAIRDVRKLVV